jgi:hypothetical protein
MPFADKISGTYPAATLPDNNIILSRKTFNNRQNGFNCFLASRCALNRPAISKVQWSFFYSISFFILFFTNNNGIFIPTLLFKCTKRPATGTGKKTAALQQ